MSTSYLLTDFGIYCIALSRLKRKGSLLDHFEASVLHAIRATRDMSFPNWGNIEVAATKSSAIDVVTEIDRSIEIHLREVLGRIDPSAGFVGEEFGGDRSKRRFWLVDPIDGTQEFVRGLPFCTTMVALIDSGLVVFSAIYDFVADAMYHASRDRGAYRNGVPIRVSKRNPEGAYVCLESKLRDERTNRASTKLRGLVNTFGVGVAGYEYAMVASGKIEGRINFDPFGKDYDYAAGSLLVSEAGGIVTNIGSDSYDYRDLNVIAVNKPLYEALTRSDLEYFS